MLYPPSASVADGDEDDAHVDGPMIKFSYDVSPMRVVLREETKPVLDWTLGMCALMGGVYTCSGLLEAFISNGVSVVKRRVGKMA